MDASGGRLLKAGRGWLAYLGRPALPQIGPVCVEDLRTGDLAMAGESVRAPAWAMDAAECKAKQQDGVSRSLGCPRLVRPVPALRDVLRVGRWSWSATASEVKWPLRTEFGLRPTPEN